MDCTCQELQPRRGKNLPEGGLDSRAKKLHPQDPEDFEFSINWINKHAHTMYKNEHNEIEGLRELTEVSLCKAHSSTLYRAKKRHERDKQPEAPPSPADSDPYNPYPSISTGGLAAKVREISSNQYPQQVLRMNEMPDFSRMSHSTSMKRKRTTYKKSNEHPPPPPTTISSSISTPLYSSRINPFLQQNYIQMQNQQQQQMIDNFPSQLPPLQRQQETDNSQIYPSENNVSPRPTFLLPKQQQDLDTIPMVIETVSLKSSESSMYYFRNLAITDTFTFRDLLNEIDMIGSPPPGKRIVISDNEKFYPLDQPIRHVIQRPASTHLDLSLGLTDKPSINWSVYS